MTKTPESILASYDSTGTASVEDLAWALRSALRTGIYHKLAGHPLSQSGTADPKEYRDSADELSDLRKLADAAIKELKVPYLGPIRGALEIWRRRTDTEDLLRAQNAVSQSLIKVDPGPQASDLVPRKKVHGNKTCILAVFSTMRSRLKALDQNDGIVRCLQGDLGVAECYINKMPDDDKLTSLKTLIDSLNDQAIYTTVNSALAQLLTEAKSFIKEPP